MVLNSQKQKQLFKKKCIISKGKLKSSTCLCTLNPIDFIYYFFCQTYSNKVDEGHNYGLGYQYLL